ncbi:hypothetical protein A3731_02360 [Roseovarius sp. HI0049]|nr:hypothetical protein A3731_02360 [Roseovarius sp. HI0049]
MDRQEMPSTYKIVLGIIGAEEQTVGNSVMAQVLTDYGFEVENIGCCDNRAALVRAAIETGADAILVSCADGLAEAECKCLRETCAASGVSDVLLYLGGRYLAAKGRWDETEALFLAKGFDRVFPPRANITRIAAKLRDDIDMRRPGAHLYGAGAFGVAPAVAAYD